MRPSEVKEAIVARPRAISGPNGMQQKDDMENWFIQTRYSKGTMTRWGLRQNNQLGMSSPSWMAPRPSAAGNFHASPTDENYRRFFEHYRPGYGRRSWDELLAMQKPRRSAQ